MESTTVNQNMTTTEKVPQTIKPITISKDESFDLSGMKPAVIDTVSFKGTQNITSYNKSKLDEYKPITDPKALKIIEQNRTSGYAGASFLKANPDIKAEWDKKGAMGIIETFNRFDKWKMVPFTGTMKDVGEMGQIYALIKKYNKKEPMTAEETKILKDFQLEMTEMNYRGQTLGGKMTTAILQMPAFVGEFIATSALLASVVGAPEGAVVGTGAVTSRASLAGLKQLVAKSLEKTTEKTLLKTIEKNAGKLVVEGTTRAVVMAPLSATDSYYNRRVNDSMAISDYGEVYFKNAQENPAITLMKSFGDTWTTQTSEVGGKFFFDPIGEAMVKGMPKGFKKAFDAFSMNTIGRVLTKSVDKAGYSNALSEIGENRLQEFLNVTLGIDQQGDKPLFEKYANALVPSFEQLLVESGAVVAFGGISHSTGFLVDKITQRTGKTSPEEVNKIIEDLKSLTETQKQNMAKAVIAKENEEDKAVFNAWMDNLSEEMKATGMSDEEIVNNRALWDAFVTTSAYKLGKTRAEVAKIAVPTVQAGTDIHGNVLNQEDALIQEASKYKSAEEFIASQSLYHGTPYELKGGKLKFGGGEQLKKGGYMGGHFLTDTPEIAQGFSFGGKVYQASGEIKNKVLDINKNKKLFEDFIGKEYETDGEMVEFTKQDYDSMFPNGKADWSTINRDAVEKIAKENGKIGIAIPEYAYDKSGVTYQLFEDEIPVKTKQELEQIWNESQKQPLYQEETKSEEFKKWFGNSKIVDENGNPLVVYHGSPNKFEIFDSSKGKKFQAKILGDGNYFTVSEKQAGIYKRDGGYLYKTYLKIENPFVINSAEDMSYIRSLKKSEIQDTLKKQGYDGIIENRGIPIYVAFNSNQIKDISNKNPTDSPNILYQENKLNILTETFKKWFRKSKVVDDNGNPLRVFHGTNEYFTDFNKNMSGKTTGAKSASKGIFFTDSVKVAESYATYAAHNAPVQKLLDEADRLEKIAQRSGKESDWQKYDDKIVEAENLEMEISDTRERGQIIMPVYLSIQNPLIIDAKGERFVDIADELNNKIDSAKVNGYDGVVIKNLDDAATFSNEESTHYVVFETNQIKSTFNLNPTEKSGLLSQGKKGFYDPVKNLIGIMPTANRSTFLHESAHAFLNFYLENLPDELDALYKWVGIENKPVSELTPEEFTKLQEAFARGFETYLAEGKAPNKSLKKIFDDFREWFIEVYKKIENIMKSGGFNIKISDDIRKLYSDMINYEEDEGLPQLYQDDQKIQELKAKRDELMNKYGKKRLVEVNEIDKMISDLEFEIKSEIKARSMEVKTTRKEISEQQREGYLSKFRKYIGESKLFVPAEDRSDYEGLITSVGKKYFTFDKTKGTLIDVGIMEFANQNNISDDVNTFVEMMTSQEYLTPKQLSEQAQRRVEQQNKPFEKLMDMKRQKQIDEISQKIEDALSGKTVTVEYAPDVYEKNRKVNSEENTILEKTLETAGELYDSLKDEANKAFVPISSALGNINEKLKISLRKFEYHRLQHTKDRLLIVKGFLEKYVKLDEIDARDLDFALKVSDMNKVNEIVKRNGMENEFVEVQNMLERMYDDAESAQLDMGYLTNYFPRRIENPKKFMKYLRASDNWTMIEEELKLKDPDGEMTLEEQAEYIGTLLRGMGSSEKALLSKPSFTKDREIIELTPEMNSFYKDSSQAIIDYVHGMTDAIEARKLFGKSGKDINDSIALVVKGMIDNGDIDYKDEERVKSILASRFANKKVAGIWTLWRDFNNLTLLANPISALTQLEDVGVTMYKAGLFNTVKGLLQSIAHKQHIDLNDLGLDQITEEFKDKGFLSNTVMQMFKTVGFTNMDRFGKETYVNGIFMKYQTLAQKGNTDFIESLKPIFGAETTQVLNDLKNGVISDNVKFLMFHELSEIQPLTMSEMPEYYARGGNTKIFYALKSFTLKRINFMREKIFRDIPKNPKKGLIELAKLIACLIAMGATTDWIKDFLLGRKTPPNDMLVNNIWKAFGFQKWVLYQARKEGLMSAMTRQIAPPFKLADDLYKDIINGRELPKWDAWASVPVAGKLYYWWFGGGHDKSEKAKKRKSKKGSRSL